MPGFLRAIDLQLLLIIDCVSFNILRFRHVVGTEFTQFQFRPAYFSFLISMEL